MSTLPSPSRRSDELRARVQAFMDEWVYPNETRYYRELAASAGRFSVPPLVEELKQRARSAGLWNLFLPDPAIGAGLGNLDYAPVCEVMGRSPFAPELFNCSAPDTGNMETLLRFATPTLRERWLDPLLEGEIRSGFAMTEPEVASSDATNIRARIERDGDHYVINARKWWTSGAADPRCRVLILMGQTDPHADRHRRQSMVLVPMDTPGVRPVRHLTVFGYDDAPRGHMEIVFDDVRVPAENLLLGEGRGFEIAQARLGPGRVHHCMRLIGVAERSLEAMCLRARERVAFGRPLAEQGVVREAIARSRIDIDQARLLVLDTAARIDADGARAARKHVAMIKAAVPRMVTEVLDRAIQVHGAAGVTGDFGLARAWAHARALRFADGPDEVHLRSIAKAELGDVVGRGWRLRDEEAT